MSAADWLTTAQPIVYKALPGPHTPGPAIAHCGDWWPVTTLPACCGQCGAVVLGDGR